MSVKNNKKILIIKKLLLGAVIIAAYCLTINNFFLLSKDMIHGDGSAENIFPQPFYGFLRIPDSANVRDHNGVNRVAADFAQIYFPSQEYSALTKNYETGYLDPWKRQSRYAPFIHFLCHISICKLEFGYASFIHILIQMLLFYFFFIIAFKILKIESDLWPGLFLVNIILFSTPAGLSWLERGQFSLYVSLSYLLLLLGLLKNKPALVIASALIAYVKWTSFPFLFVVIVVYLLSSRNIKEGIRNIRISLIYALTILLLSLPYKIEFIRFVEGLFRQERYVPPMGISLALILNANFVKGLPFILILLGYLHLQRNNKNFNSLIPYLIGCGILLLTYPRLAFVYNIPNLFCFLPLIFYWTKQPSIQSSGIRYTFIFFILLISFPDYLKLLIGNYATLAGYFAVSLLFLFLPLLYPGEFLIQMNIESPTPIKQK